jgi:hypothetical protein
METHFTSGFQLALLDEGENVPDEVGDAETSASLLATTGAA